jgi:uncharacterized membrane protein
VLIRMLEVLVSVASCERQPARLQALRHHADLVLTDAKRCTGNPSDLADISRRHAAFTAMEMTGPSVLI